MDDADIETAAWLEAAYDALASDDVALFLTAFAPDVRWNLLGMSAGLHFAGLRIGHQAVRDMISMIYRDFKIRDFFIEDIIANRKAAAVRWSALATSLRTGQKLQIDVFDHIVIRNGMIVSLTQFFDSAAIGATAGHLRRVEQPPHEDG